MPFLPVAEREMRVASRDRNTYRLRAVYVLLPLTICAITLWFVTFFPVGIRIPGRELFLILTWLEYGLCLFFGVTLTADVVSEEKRESTLGLLFLTDLKSYDVSFGKLIAAGIRGFYGLLGAAPVLSLPVLLGGVEINELVRTMVALLLTLIFCLCAGLFVSSLCQRGWQALSCSMLLVMAFAAGTLMLAELWRQWFGYGGWVDFLALLSPTTMVRLSQYAPTGIWTFSKSHFLYSSGIVAALSLLFFGLATFIIPRSWQEPGGKSIRLKIRERLARATFGSAKSKAALRRKFLALNPFFWVASRRIVPWTGNALVIITMIIFAGWLIHKLRSMGMMKGIQETFFIWGWLGGIWEALLIGRIPAVAGERFSQDRKSGALELILSTDLTIAQIIRGQWLAILRQCGVLLGVVLFLEALGFLIYVNSALVDLPTFSIVKMLKAPFLAIFLNTLPDRMDWEICCVGWVIMGLVFCMMLHRVTLGWVAMWVSLRVKKPLFVPGVSAVLVFFPPVFIFILTMAEMSYKEWFWDETWKNEIFAYCLALSLVILFDSLLIFWARRNLYQNFRSVGVDRFPAERTKWWKLSLA